MSHRDESNDPQEEKTDAGAEGAAGINSVSGQERGRKGAPQKGSEPLEETEVHKSGYGGDGGSPKTSSDQRERSG